MAHRKPNLFAKQLGVELRKMNLKGKTKAVRQDLFRKAAAIAKRKVASPSRHRAAPKKRSAAGKKRATPKRRTRRSGLSRAPSLQRPKQFASMANGRLAQTLLLQGSEVAQGQFPDPGSALNTRSGDFAIALLAPGGFTVGAGSTVRSGLTGLFDIMKRNRIDPNIIARGGYGQT